MTAIEGSDWATGLEARSRALVGEGQEAEQCYAEAVERLGRTQLRPELARAHLLYGEWLRRELRRGDARHQLRAAYDLFAVIGAEAFAERARRELLAAGEKVRKRQVDTYTELTPQEEHIVRLARMDAPTPRSPRNCSSAPAPSNGISPRCSRSRQSPSCRTFIMRCPRQGQAHAVAPPTRRDSHPVSGWPR